MLEPYITERRVKICAQDIVTVLGQENPFITKCTPALQTALKDLGMLHSQFVWLIYITEE